METRSYEFDRFDESASELGRLGKQASRMEPFEISLLQSAGLKEGMRAIDVGCGPGFVARTIAKLVGKGGEVIGIDASQDLLDAAENAQKSARLENLRFHKTDIYNIDLPAESFDFAYSRLVFQHLARPQEALDQIRRIINPGGIMCVVDIDDQWLSLEPEPEGFRNLVNRSVRIQEKQGGDRYIGHKLGAILEQGGFHSVDVQIMPVTSRMMGMRNFLDIGMSFRARAEEDKKTLVETEEDLEELYALAEDPQAWGFMAVFVATGRKDEVLRDE